VQSTGSPNRSTSGAAALDALVAARTDGDPRRCRRAEEAVVVQYLSVAAAVAGRYRRRGVDFDDLEQVARLGLIKAVRRWRPQAGGFLQYAMPTIEGEVKRYFRDCGSTIRVPRVLYEAQPQVVAATAALRQESSREPTVSEIALRADVPEQRVRDIRAATSACRPLSTDGCEALDGMSSPDAERELSAVAIRAGLRPALADLSDRERHIIALRFVWGQSQLQIATALGVSQMQVSRVLRAALDTLRERMAVWKAPAT
jgi:RNA polymerase sigma-B factor